MPFEWKGPRSGRIDIDTAEEVERSPAAKLPQGTRLHPEGSRQGYLEPDATLIGRSGDDVWAVLIEYDRTERPHKQIDRLRRYDRWLLDGWRDGHFATHSLAPAVVFLTARERPAAPPDRDGRSDLLRVARPRGRRPARGHPPGPAAGRVHQPRADSRRRLDDAADAEPAAGAAGGLGRLLAPVARV